MVAFAPLTSVKVALGILEKNSRKRLFIFFILVFHDRYFFIFLKRCILFTIILEIFSANATETVPNYTIFLRCF